MARINLTLDSDTYGALEKHVRATGQPRARVVKELLIEALAQRASRERRTRLARDYAAGRADARTLLRDLETCQLGLLDDEDA